MPATKPRCSSARYRNTRPAPCRHARPRSLCRLHSCKARVSATFQQTTLLPRLTCDWPRGRFPVRAHGLQPIPYPCRRRQRAPSTFFTKVILPSPLKSMRIKSPSFTCPTPHPLCPAPNAHRSSLLQRQSTLGCPPSRAGIIIAGVEYEHSASGPHARMAAVTLEVSSL